MRYEKEKREIMGFVRRLMVIAGLAIALAAFTGLGASAQTVCEPYVGECTEPSRQDIPTVRVAPTGGARQVATEPTGSLPVTGADIAGLVVLAIVLVGGGLALVVVSRRRRSSLPEVATS